MFKWLATKTFVVCALVIAIAGTYYAIQADWLVVGVLAVVGAGITTLWFEWRAMMCNS